jgi:hypothetical protein
MVAFLLSATAAAVLLMALVLPPAPAHAATAAGPAPEPAATAGATPAPGSVVVVRFVGGKDTLWSIDPGTAAATELVALPFRTSLVEASPGAGRLAFLTLSWIRKPEVCVYDTSNGEVSTWSLAAHGLRWVDSLTWLSSTRLLIAGRSRNNLFLFTDRLYTLDTTTGALHGFAGLAGTDPSAAPAAHRLIFVRLSPSGPATAAGRWVVERLYGLRLGRTAKPVVIAATRYFTRALCAASQARVCRPTAPTSSASPNVRASSARTRSCRRPAAR